MAQAAKRTTTRLAGRIAAVALLNCACALAADPEADLLAWLDAIAQRQLDARDAAIAQVRSAADAKRRNEFVRSKVLDLLGGLPDYNGPLNARIARQVRRPGYAIDNVIFESLPHYYVTGNLYRPDRAGRFPGVLMPVGHWEIGKAEVQRIAANLALKGFVVFAYDPVGQGERLQEYDRRLEASLAGGPTEQHFLDGARADLDGKTLARYLIFDAKRALDYLISRPEVDAARIGCTGCSGGGTLTTYISALDPRIQVAAPACYMNSFRILFRGSVGDSEQSPPGFLASGLDQTDYVELFAPKPWLILSTEKDFFTPAGAKVVFEEARRWFGIFGAEDKIKWVVGPGEHGTPLVVREAIYDWMLRWLNHGDGSPAEQPIELLPEFELWATKTGQVADLSDSRDLSAVIRENFERSKTHGSREELLEALRRWMSPPANAPEFAAVRQSIVRAAAASRMPGVLYVAMNERDVENAASLAGGNEVVMTVWPRGLPARTSRAFSGEWMPNTRAALLGLNLPGLRARDIVNAVTVLAAHENVDASHIRAEADGIAGIWLLMAAAVDPRLQEIRIRRTPYSLRAAYDNPLSRDLTDAVMPGFAAKWDLADLVDAIRPRTVTWTDPTDWMGRVVPLPGNYRYSPIVE